MLAEIVLASCVWANPGADPYTGDVPAAVESYKEIPAATRAKLRHRMESRKYDDVAEITRDGIVGDAAYSDLRGMHFGKNKVCSSVNRSQWAPSMKERGLVYCEDGHCLIVPTVCNNVSLVTRNLPPSKPAESSGGGGGGLVVAYEPVGGGTTTTFTEVTYPAEPVPAVPTFEDHSRVEFVYIEWPIYYPGPVVYIHEPCCIPCPIPSPVPEPATAALLLAGLGLCWFKAKGKLWAC